MAEKLGKNSSDSIKVIFTGIIISFFATLIFIILSAFAISLADVSEGVMQVISVLSVAFGAFIGGFFTSKLKREKGLVTGAVIGFLLFVLITIFSMIVSGASMTIFTALKFVASVVSASLGGVIGVNFKRKRKFL